MNTPLDDGGPVASIMTLGDKGEVVPVGGLSIRDWFAGQALSSMDYGWFGSSTRIREMVEESYCIADAMLAAGKEKP